MPVHAQQPISHASHTNAATPMAFVRSMLAACARLGHDPAPALAAAQIAPSQAGNAHARITASQMERLSDQLMRELDDEALGWFNRRLPWGSYGMLARASISAPTLGVALKRWCRHHSLLTDDVRLTLAAPASGKATVTLTEPAPAPWLAGELREFCHVSLLRNLLGWWTRACRCWRWTWPTPPQHTPMPMPCCLPGRVGLTNPTPACTWTPATWPCPCGAMKPPCARCCNAPCP